MSSPTENVTVNVHTLGGKRKKVEVSRACSVQELKSAVAVAVGVCVQTLSLVYGNDELSEAGTTPFAALQEDSVDLHVVTREAPDELTPSQLAELVSAVVSDVPFKLSFSLACLRSLNIAGELEGGDQVARFATDVLPELRLANCLVELTLSEANLDYNDLEDVAECRELWAGLPESLEVLRLDGFGNLYPHYGILGAGLRSLPRLQELQIDDGIWGSSDTAEYFMLALSAELLPNLPHLKRLSLQACALSHVSGWADKEVWSKFAKVLPPSLKLLDLRRNHLGHDPPPIFVTFQEQLPASCEIRI